MNPETGSKLLWHLMLLYVLLYTLISPRDATEGIHWGNRLVLVLYPLLAVMSAGTLESWRRVHTGRITWASLVVGLTILISLAAQAYSITLLDRKRDFTRRLNVVVKERPEGVILTDIWWAPLEMYSVFYDRPIFRVRSPEDPATLMPKLSEAGYDACLLATLPNRQIDLPLVALVDDGGLNYFSLKLYRIELGK